MHCAGLLYLFTSSLISINCILWSLVMTSIYTVGEISSLTQTRLGCKYLASFGLICCQRFFLWGMISLSFNKPQPKIYWNSASNRGEEQRERIERKREKMKGERNGGDKAMEGNIKLLRKKEPIKPERKTLDRHPETKVWSLLCLQCLDTLYKRLASKKKK